MRVDGRGRESVLRTTNRFSRSKRNEAPPARGRSRAISSQFLGILKDDAVRYEQIDIFSLASATATSLFQSCALAASRRGTFDRWSRPLSCALPVPLTKNVLATTCIVKGYCGPLLR